MSKAGLDKAPPRKRRQLLSSREDALAQASGPDGVDKAAFGDPSLSNQSSRRQCCDPAVDGVSDGSETGSERLEPDPKCLRVDGDHSAALNCHQADPNRLVTFLPTASHGADRASSILHIEREMSAQLLRASFVGGKVTHVYNPLEHAAVPHGDYVRQHGGYGAAFLLVGMNPGPWGMSQTGVPFGEVAAVRDWLGVTGEVAPPTDEHPQRPVTGLHCTRSEVSGRRFWSLWRRLCGTPDRLFRHAFVHNFCPLAFMERSGRNVTPNCLSRTLRERVETICGPALVKIIQVLGTQTVIGIGKYAEDQTRRALRAAGLEDRVQVFPLLHPSPINPQANKDWDGVATRQLTEAGLLPLLTSPD